MIYLLLDLKIVIGSPSFWSKSRLIWRGRLSEEGALTRAGALNRGNTVFWVSRSCASKWYMICLCFKSCKLFDSNRYLSYFCSKDFSNFLFKSSLFKASNPLTYAAYFTPYNVGSVLWRLFSALEVVQYIGGITSLLWGIASVLWGDSFSTVGVVQYSGGIALVLWGIASVLWRWFSTVGDNISTCGGITSVLWGITSVLWRVFSTVEGYLQYCGGITAVFVGR